MSYEAEDYSDKLEQEATVLTNKESFFPELVWESVMKKIKSRKDIEACSNASIYFWRFLEGNRQQQVVLPKVLYQLSHFFSKYKIDSGNDQTAGQDEHLSMRLFWKLRLIAKPWNAIIEQLHQSREAGHYLMKADMERFENVHLRPWATQCFDPQSLPQQFVDHFDATHYDLVRSESKKNPFLGRSVHFNGIHLGNHAQIEDIIYFSGIVNMLTKYGRDIWYAFFDFRDIAGTNIFEIYTQLVAYLRLLPNLKVLRVACKHENVEGPDYMQAPLNAVRSMNLTMLRREISLNPLPVLSQLEYIWTTDLPTGMFIELLQRNRHVEKLQVERQERHSDYSIFEEHLPNLTALNINFCSFDDFGKFEDCRVRLNLKRFYFWYDSPTEILTWSRLFWVLDKQLDENCTELLLQMPIPKTEQQSAHDFDDTRCGRLNLPNLEKVAVFTDATISLDFLLAAKQSLGIIMLSYFNGDEEEYLMKHFDEYMDKQVVKYIGYKDRMEDSNIWEEFPELFRLSLLRKKEMGGSVGYNCRRNTDGKLIFDKERWCIEK